MLNAVYQVIHEPCRMSVGLSRDTN